MNLRKFIVFDIKTREARLGFDIYCPAEDIEFVLYMSGIVK